METLTIDVSKWRTGQNGDDKTGEGHTFLLNMEGFMCCLGFECIRLGVQVDEIKNISGPYNVITDANISELVQGGTENCFSLKAIEINDDEYMTLPERKKQLAAHFSTIGVEVVFING